MPRVGSQMEFSMPITSNPHSLTPELARILIQVAEQKDRHAHAELFRAVYERRINLLLFNDPRAQITNTDVCHNELPILAVISGNNDFPCGPDQWRSARFLTAWARTAMVHGAVAKPKHYQMAIMMALNTGRALLIETASFFTEPWTALMAGKIPVTGFVPPYGGMHPDIPAGETVH
jgi:hypothetical protein